MRQGRREKAFQLLRPYAQKCEVDCYEYWVVVRERGSDNILDEVDGPYCQKCIKKAVREFRKNNKKKYKQIIDSVSYYSADSENNCFQFCEGCGKHIQVSLLIDAQELEHWETLDKLDSFKPKYAYELREVLERDDAEYHDRLDTLAERVIAEHEGDIIIDSFEARLVDFLSPDLFLYPEYISLKYGVERTLVVAQYLNQLFFKDYGYNCIFSIGSGSSDSYDRLHNYQPTQWRKNLSIFFHRALAQEWGYNLRGRAELRKWETEISERKKLLRFDRPTMISLPGVRVHQYAHEVDERKVVELLTRFNGRRLNFNPHAQSCPERDGWEWRIEKVDLLLTGRGLAVCYYFGDQQQARSSVWDEWIEFEKGETVVGFLERCWRWFEESTLS